MLDHHKSDTAIQNSILKMDDIIHMIQSPPCIHISTRSWSKISLQIVKTTQKWVSFIRTSISRSFQF